MGRLRNRRTNIDLKSLPDTERTLEILRVRHPYAIQASEQGLEEADEQVVESMGRSQEQSMGRLAFNRLVAAHHKAIEKVDGTDGEVIEEAMHDYAISIVNLFVDGDCDAIDWWRCFVGEIDPLVHGAVAEGMRCV
ncbi:MAG: hypothetical protein AAGJ40_09290 [Planctomycetota bacterium]